ncbi:MAG: cytochrome-c peroxidase [Pirellulales bacterium]|nr:cytochrome-c peroxidase [Pirellulales bacterium]
MLIFVCSLGCDQGNKAKEKTKSSPAESCCEEDSGEKESKDADKDKTEKAADTKATEAKVPEKKAAETKAPEKKAAEAKAPVAKPAANKPTADLAKYEALLDNGKVKTPLGLPPVPIPADNPMTAAKIALGEKLYFDKRLSKDGTISCATCHDPAMAWAEHTPTSKGIGKQVGGANSPSVINSAYATSQFWDGRAGSLEEQALGPIENPIEMGHELKEMIADLNNLSEYKEAFQQVFGTDVTREGVAMAIAAFERTVLSGNSPYDKFKAGDKKALTDSQKRGMELFEEVGCSTCHTPPVFSNFRFYNAGIGMDKKPPDEGRKAVTKKDRDLGKFRVPMLREVANTAPYYHDGSVATLEEAVAIMADGGKKHEKVSGMLKAVGENKISPEGKKDLVEFMKALSGDYPRKPKS